MGRIGWLAWAYFANFWIYGITIGVEMYGYMRMMDGDGTLLAKWLRPWGFWFTILMFWIPPWIAMMQLVLPEADGGIASKEDGDSYNQTWFHMFFGYVLWITHSLFHVVKQCV